MEYSEVEHLVFPDSTVYIGFYDQPPSQESGLLLNPIGFILDTESYDVTRRTWIGPEGPDRQ